MELVETVEKHREACNAIRRSGSRVGFVPTMGALHAGHASLMRRAREDGFTPVVSIFVNPTQFGPNEDYERYPRTLESDLRLCEEQGTSLVFVPSAAEVYPAGDATRIRVSGLTEGLCGASRPGHFDGVTTVVTKLLAATGPCFAFFGRKDYQQYRVISRLVRDLLLPVTIVGCTTVREPDGLALSSRNRYLSDAERARALGIARGLADAERAFCAGERSPSALVAAVQSSLAHSDLREDYVAVRDPLELTPLESAANVPDQVLLAVAAYCGTTRLIDNMVLGEEAPPVVSGVA